MNLRQLFALSVQEQASDLHLSPGLPPLMRVDGDLVPVKNAAPLTADETQRLLYSLMDDKKRQTFETILDLDFAIHEPPLALFRVHVFHQEKGIAAVFRVLPESPLTLEQLKLPLMLKQLVEFPPGLILVTGPTGSGKSTTLAALIDYMNATYPYHVITLEDPIEYIHHSRKSLVSQRQVYRDTPSFSAALRAAVREDPDVILVGEMRDLETIRLALTAAETGHRVLATLHTRSAPSAVSRIVDVFPAGEKNAIRNMLAESLTAVICQTLVKKISGGRVAALELMVGTSAIRHLIREDKIAQLHTFIQTSKEVGMRTLDQSLLELLSQQRITLETARQAAVNKELFKGLNYA